MWNIWIFFSDEIFLFRLPLSTHSHVWALFHMMYDVFFQTTNMKALTQIKVISTARGGFSRDEFFSLFSGECKKGTKFIERFAYEILWHYWKFNIYAVLFISAWKNVRIESEKLRVLSSLDSLLCCATNILFIYILSLCRDGAEIKIVKKFAVLLWVQWWKKLHPLNLAKLHFVFMEKEKCWKVYV